MQLAAKHKTSRPYRSARFAAACALWMLAAAALTSPASAAPAQPAAPGDPPAARALGETDFHQYWEAFQLFIRGENPYDTTLTVTPDQELLRNANRKGV